VILQSFSTRPESGRNWRDYLPKPAHVDVLAWDVYNRASPDAGYQVPPDLLDAPLRALQSIDRSPWPSSVARSPQATRAHCGVSWLRRMGIYRGHHHALFVCYFNFQWKDGNDYRLRDGPSVRAWKAMSAR
jgi:hypothetical protein